MFPFWAVIAANTLAAICMGAYLWHRHPAFRHSIHDTPLGAARCTEPRPATRRLGDRSIALP